MAMLDHTKNYSPEKLLLFGVKKNVLKIEHFL